jgi:hypothetical protein
MAKWNRGIGGDIAEAVSSAGDITGDLLKSSASMYSKTQTGSIDGPTVANGQGTMVNAVGSDSLFNPFRIFRYSKFADSQKGYNLSNHKFIYNEPRSTDNSKEVFNNPTATQIIEWANLKAASKGGPMYPYPYQINDFLWCKYYGKIPNNRLVTLRRYPIPVEDNLAIHQDRLPLIPLAQAVTWWGGDTGNSLDKILGMTYKFNWGDLNTKVQDVTGNEVGAGSALDVVGLTETSAAIGGLSGKTVRQIISATVFADDNNKLAASGADKIYQEYDKASYGPEGPYWNRVLGPVNVINSSKTRTEGLVYEQSIELTFEYNLRSYGRVNPKVAMLDLISNFLSLTYSTAPFFGGSIRYFRQTGYLAPAFNTDEMEKGNYVDGMIEAAGAYLNSIEKAANNFKDFAQKINEAFTGGATATADDATNMGEGFTDRLKTAVSTIGNSRLANDIIGARLAPLIQEPLRMRALLDGRAVGEWHVMVGNPADPIAVIGNLCLSSTTMSFSEELGEDDFPVGVKFTVKLDPGRPRAKQDIESMFNLGGGNLTYTALADPTSNYSSYGEYASDRANTLNSGKVSAESVETSKANNIAEYFKKNVDRSYGVNFGASQALPDYFMQVKTKD